MMKPYLHANSVRFSPNRGMKLEVQVNVDWIRSSVTEISIRPPPKKKSLTKKAFLDTSIQQMFDVLLKKEALVLMCDLLKRVHGWKQSWDEIPCEALRWIGVDQQTFFQK